MLNEDYIMDMFSSRDVNVDPFIEYLKFMFTEKESKPVAGYKSDDGKLLPMMNSKLTYFIHP